jgi:hypothetical protein
VRYGLADLLAVGPEDQPQRTICDAQHTETLPGAQLLYLNRPGALNKSLSDVFGSLV